MDKYLYRVSTKRTNAWSNRTPKPLYLVAESKESAEKLAVSLLRDGLSVSKITRMAVQCGGTIFTGI